MEVKIPKKYLKKKEDGVFPAYIIDAPKNTPELSGYVLKISQDVVKITDTSLILTNGNEWDKKNRVCRFMFEKEEKIKGHPSKRYRYTEEEMIILYGCAESPDFEKRLRERITKSQSGPGRLIRATYSDYEDHEIKSSTDWMIVSETNQKWVYEFEYDPLHYRNAIGYSSHSNGEQDEIQAKCNENFSDENFGI